MSERISKLAGKQLPQSALVNIPRLLTAYFTLKPDPAIAAQRVAFGTSGHRGNAFATSFNEAHILAITQAVCLYRARQGITGPLFIGMDTHALSEAAFASAIEVLAANTVDTMIDASGGYTPTPVVSHAIISHNRGRSTGLADGIIISPSHNPPADGGFKYNPPHGGPADTDATGWIQTTANELIEACLAAVKRIPYARARSCACIHPHDYITGYVADLASIIDIDAIRSAGVRIGIDPLGGAAAPYWQPLIERFNLQATVVDDTIDPTFRFMPADWDGNIRMDCSSPHAMTALIAMRDRFDIAFATDPDADRHGIVTPSGGLMNPNYFLASAIAYLTAHRPDWAPTGAIGKTVVSSGMIDRVVAKAGRPLMEVPVGFKWFSAGLMDRSLVFGGEESAGASFVRRDGSVWTTDKDGLIMGLLAAEITARTGRDPHQYYEAATEGLGTSCYERIDAAATAEQKAKLTKLTPADITATTLAGDPIEMSFSVAPGNNAPIGGIKVTTKNGWFAARPSGTEDVSKIYAESFQSAEHLARIQQDAQAMIGS